MSWIHTAPTILASFLASLVEFVEALTVILAVGTVRGWRSAIAGGILAVAALFALVVVLGSALTRIPFDVLQFGVGLLLTLFGLRWLRKAILRSAGVIRLHDETAAFAEQTAALDGIARGGMWDRVALATTFQITMVEGIEVVFIVIAIGAGGAGLLIPASLGALGALFIVALLGVALHKPLANVPENTLKFVVGVLLSSFGIFWVGEGLGLIWPGGDWSLPALVAGFLIVSLAAVPLCRAQSPRPPPRSEF